MSSYTSSADELTHTIAIECEALELTLSQLGNDYHETPRMLGKSWFAVALESNEGDVQKDSANKDGVLKRMVDAIIAFVKRVAERVRKFFGSTDKKQVEETAHFAKEYRGPTDEELKKAVDEYMRSQAASNAHTQKATDALRDHEPIQPTELKRPVRPNAPAKPQESNQAKEMKDNLNQKAESTPLKTEETLQAAVDNLNKATGKKATEEDLKEMFRQRKVRMAVAKLGRDGVIAIVAAANPRFYAKVQEGIKIMESLSNDGDVYKISHNRDKYAELDGISRFLKRFMDDARQDGEEKNIEVLTKWVMNENHLISTQATGYILNGMELEFVGRFMDGTAKRLEAYKSSTHDTNAAETINVVQKALSFYTNFFNIAMSVHTHAKSLVNIIRW